MSKDVPGANSILDRLDIEIDGVEEQRDAAVAALYVEIDLLDLAPVTFYARLSSRLPDKAIHRRWVKPERTVTALVEGYETYTAMRIRSVNCYQGMGRTD